MPPNTPSELEPLGVTEREWADAVERLRKDVNSLRPGFYTAPCCLYTMLSIFTLCLICPWMCAKQKKNIMAWDTAFRAWQAWFNETVLVPKGGFCKSQSLCYVTYGNNGEKQRHFVRWLAVAFQPEAANVLKSQPHLLGDVDNRGCCNGVNESECCMHP